MTQFISGAGCFSGDTLITTPDGTKRIDSIKVGDFVISFDDKGRLHKAEVTAVHIHEKEPVCLYRFWGNYYLVSTPNHWVLNQFNAFVAIGSLNKDDCIIDKNNHLRPFISSVKQDDQVVYNLTVKDYHNFIANDLCVHNAGLGLGAIFGAGGGKGSGGSSSPDIDDDNLNSRAYARVIDLLSEGEIEGFPSAKEYTKGTDQYNKAALKDIYFDKVAVLRSKAKIGDLDKSDYNFKNVRYDDFDIRFGTQNQTYISGFSAAESEYSVDVVVKKGQPITRTITDSDVDRVRVTLTWQALQEIEDDGDITGAEVEYQISVSYNGGAYTDIVEKTIRGRTGDPYQRSHIITLNGEFPVDIRVKRETKNYSDPKVQTQFSWTSYTEIVDAKLRYPNSALLAAQIDAKNFSSIPNRSYRIRGIKVKIPSGVSVDQSNGRIIYPSNFIWDGTFGAAVWCADPAWCLWDLLTNCRYGFGQHIKSRDLDKWSFYQASQYCNSLIDSGLKDSNGNPVLEPRFLCNVNIQTQEEAYKLINDMCSVFRAMPYWGAGTLVISQDSPASPSYLFNQTNVTEDGFQYSGSSLKTRHTVAVVSYLDIENQELNYESVEDPEGIARYGVVTTEVSAFACTSRTQAHRVGEWLLYTEQYESETITFKTSIDGGIAVRPGMIIAVSDPLKAGARRGGRIRAQGANYIVVDEPLSTDMPVTGSPTVHVSMADGTVEIKNVSSVSGAKITIVDTFTSTPLVGGVFIYNNDAMRRSLWRALSISESDGVNYQITAISHNPTKYEYVERGAELNKKVYLPLTIDQPTDPVNLNAQVATYQSSGQLANKMIVSWENDPNATQYQVRYRAIG